MTARRKMPLWKVLLLGFFFIFFVVPMFFAMAMTVMGVGKHLNDGVEPQVEVVSHEEALAQAKRKAESDNNYFAMELCTRAQRAVKEQLKSPASADFPGCVLGVGEYEIRTNEDRSKAAVKGYVDAQNSFGAMLRYRFVVLFDKQPDGSYETRVAMGQ